ncbi:MAG: LPS translocon maturation chaperone LptM [Gammaproteobacteria bacterium]
MKRLFVPMLFVTVAALLSGCGQKGPLYLPPPRPHPHPPVATTQARALRATTGAGTSPPHV